jgi:outer membrane autotransporter protein
MSRSTVKRRQFLMNALAVMLLVVLTSAVAPSLGSAQQVIANGTTQTASGTINTGVLAPIAGYGLFALNNGILNSSSPLTVITGGTASDAAHAQSGGSITLFSGSSVSTTGGIAVGLLATGIDSVVNAADTAVVTTGSNSRGVEAIQGGTVNLTGGSIMTAGSMAWGLFASQANSKISATNVTIETTGGAGYGARGIAAGRIALDGGSITTAGSGADALITIDSTATIEATNTIIHTSGATASGANAFFGTMTLDNITITTVGDGSHGARVDNAGGLTVTGGSFKTSGASSFGLLSNAGSTLTATNATVVTSGASGIGASAQFGGQLTLNGGTITTSGASAAGLFSVGLLSTLSSTPAVQPGPVLLNDAATPSAGPTGSSIIANGVTVRTSGSGSHGASIRGGSSLAMDNSSIAVSGAGASALFSSAYDTGASTARINNSTLSAAQGAGIRASGTTLNATFAGSSITGSPNLLEVVGNGALNLVSGSSILTGAAMTEAGSTSNVTLQDNSTWNVTGNSNVTNLTVGPSLIQFRPPTGDPTLLTSYKTLTAVNYIGQGGTLHFNTFLGTDGSPSDRLVINGGSATGNSLVGITNAGGPGAGTTGNGILVVQASNGGTTASNAFRLLAGELRAGAFDYRLFRGAQANLPNPSDVANSWFLRSSFVVEPVPPVPPPTLPGPEEPIGPGPPPQLLPPGVFPIIGPELATYGVVQPIARQMGLTTLGTLHERIGDAAADAACLGAAATGTSYGAAITRAPAVPNGGCRPTVWGRLFGQQIDNRYQAFADPRATGQVAGIQTGADVWRGSLIPGHSDTAGFYFAYGNSNVGVDGLVTNPAATAYILKHTGSVNLNAYSLGGYWTHYGPTGWYIDAVLQGSFYNGNATTQFANLATNGTGFTSSLEAGYPIPLSWFGPRFVLEPEGQIIWQQVSFQDASDGLGPVGLGTTSGATGRLGLRGKWTISDPAGRVWQPYVLANVWRDWGAHATTMFGPDPVPLLEQATRLEFVGGLNANLFPGLSLYAQAGYQFAVRDTDGGRRDGVKGDFGVRYAW